MRITDKIEKLQAFNPREVAEESFTETAETYADFNAEQMFSGQTAEDTQITLEGRKGYRKTTFDIKRSKGQPTDRITLRDTGAFHRGLYARIQGNKILTGSTDSKADEIEERTGKQIFGLNEGNKKTFATGVFLRAILAKAKAKL